MSNYEKRKQLRLSLKELKDTFKYEYENHTDTNSTESDNSIDGSPANCSYCKNWSCNFIGFDVSCLKPFTFFIYFSSLVVLILAIVIAYNFNFFGVNSTNSINFISATSNKIVFEL